MKRFTLLYLFLLFLLSCSPSGVRNTDTYVIRYVDLPRVYAFAVKYEDGSSVKEGDVKQGGAVKSRIYGKIKTAISNVARRQNADFILNTGDAVLYSRSSYDITDDVIREYKKINDITSPEVK